MNPIVPFQFYPDRHDAMLQALLEMHSRYGIRRFLLTGPGLGVRLIGFPEQSVYKRIGELVLHVKDVLAPHGIDVGWWCSPTLKSGQGPFQNIVGLDGHVATISSCPLDPAFRAALSSGLAVAAAIARPFMLQIEDDFELSNHPGVGFGCFCPLHLAEFAARTGHVYRREELVEIFRRRTPESLRLRQLWYVLSCDSLVTLAGEIEHAVHAVSPETRLSLCQPGCADMDGDLTAPVTQALAGANRPAVRVYGSAYASDTGRELPEEMFNVMYSCEHLTETFEIFYEADTYPHTCFFTSATKLQSMLAVALSCGCDDSLFYATQYLDDPLEESSYLAMYAERVAQFTVWRNEMRACRLTGCEILYRPNAVTAAPWDGGAPSVGVPWSGVLGRYGLPYTTRSGDGVKLLSGETAAVLTEPEIHAVFSGGVLLDGRAAQILDERGYGNLLGASIERGGPATFCSERLRKNTGDSTVKGELIYNVLFAPAGAEAGGFYHLTPHSGTEVLSDFLDPHDQVVQPGMLRFENQLGGRVGIIAFDLQHTRSSAIFCYRKRSALVQLIEWLNRRPVPVKVQHDPNIFLLANRSSSNCLFLTVINLSADPRTRLRLSVADDWAGAPTHQLTVAGQWESVTTIWEGSRLEVSLELAIMQPLYLRIQPS